jgi:hypothetical protein
VAFFLIDFRIDNAVADKDGVWVLVLRIGTPREREKREERGRKEREDREIDRETCSRSWFGHPRRG